MCRSPRSGRAVERQFIATSAMNLCAALVLGFGCTTARGAPTTPARPATPPGATAANPAAEEIVVRTNAERTSRGLPVLARNPELMRAAQLQTDQMAEFNTMAHELPGASYPTPASRLDAVGYQMSASAENVAEGYPTSAAVVAGWMMSLGHHANIVSTRYSEMGAGVTISRKGQRYYAQVFAHPR